MFIEKCQGKEKSNPKDPVKGMAKYLAAKKKTGRK
jgi:hypothetical protein